MGLPPLRTELAAVRPGPGIRQPADLWREPRTPPPDGTVEVSDWFDLTAVDESAVKHDPFPSHTAQNMLRRAWTAYLDTHGRRRPVTLGTGRDDAAVPAQHRRGPPHRRTAAAAFESIQLRVVTLPIAAPGAAATAAGRCRRRSRRDPAPALVEGDLRWELTDADRTHGPPHARLAAACRRRAAPRHRDRCTLLTRTTAVSLYAAAVLRIGYGLLYLVFLLREFPHRDEIWGPGSPWTPALARQLFDQTGWVSILTLSDSRVYFELCYAAGPRHVRACSCWAGGPARCPSSSRSWWPRSTPGRSS